MPNIKSAEKRLRQDKRKHMRNKAVKSALKTQEKKLKESIESGEGEAIKSNLKVIFSALDTAARKGVIHKKKAARKKSRLATLTNVVKS